MRRFFTSQLPTVADQIIDLPVDVMRHISTVLRQTQGFQFELFDGAGNIALCQLEAGGQRARIQRLEKMTPAGLRIELIQGLAKGDKLELILQKGTELGMAKIVLTPSARTVVKITQDKRGERLQRWKKIVHEACRQCGQLFVPEVVISESLSSSLRHADGELKLMLWEEATLPLAAFLPLSPPTTISLLVGPEGGFSAAEAAEAQTAGFKPIRLGPRILRTETAGLAILSILQYVYGDFSNETQRFSSSTHGKELS
jgi:16S rRNA (uracil1498-N3)-methyltransferase